MKRRSIHTLTLCILAGSGLGSLRAEDKISLSLDWKRGKTYVQKIDLTQVVGVPRHGEAQAKTHLEMGLTAAAGSLQASFDALKVDVDVPAPASDQTYDSTNPSKGNEHIGQFYTALHAQQPKLLLDERGKVREVTGLEQLTSDNPIINRLLGKEQIANLMQQGWLADLPNSSVGKGDTWPLQMKFPTPVGALIVKGNYTLGGKAERAGHSVVQIQLQGQVQGDFTKPDPKEKDKEVLRVQALMLIMGVKVKEGTVQGMLWYDPNSKMLVGSEVETNIRLSVDKYPENGKATEIPIRQKMTLSLTEK
jgi:uncharacterized protein (DUF2147 family)